MYYVGIDIGGMSMKVGIVSINGEIVISRAIPTFQEAGYEEMIKRVSDLIIELCGELKISVNSLAGIGVGIPGIADSSRGFVQSAINIGWKNVTVVEELGKYFDIPVKISNDANCAALGEQKFGGGQGYNSAVMITLGTGVGSGIVIDGKLVEGNGSAGAEAGHMVIVIDGEPCNCGRNGCWERYASATALIQQTKKAMQAHSNTKLHDIAKKYGKVNGRTAFLAADEGDIVAKEVVEKYIRYIAVGLMNLAHIIHPEVFIIGGGISHEGDKLIRPLQDFMDNMIDVSGFYPQIKITRATLGNDAGIIGAAALVM